MMRTMKNRIALYRWMIVAWLLLGWLPVSAQTESVFGKSSMTNDQWAMTNMQYQTALLHDGEQHLDGRNVFSSPLKTPQRAMGPAGG